MPNGRRHVVYVMVQGQFFGRGVDGYQPDPERRIDSTGVNAATPAAEVQDDRAVRQPPDQRFSLFLKQPPQRGVGRQSQPPRRGPRAPDICPNDRSDDHGARIQQVR